MRLRHAVLLSLLAAACSEAPPASGVAHLDLRLADGGSSAEVLAGKRRVFAQWTVEDVESDLAPWFLHDHFIKVPARGDRPGILVGDQETDPGVFPRVMLSWRGSVLAHHFNVLELDLKKYHASNARLAWRLASDPPDEPLGRHAVDVTLEATSGQEVCAIALEGHPDWTGEVLQLTFTPCTEGPQRFEVSGMRFVQKGYSMGADPLRAEHEPRPFADGGLIAVGDETRRTWPTDWDVPLFDEVRVPRGGTLSIDTAIPGTLADFEHELVFAIDVRTRKTKWIEIASRAFVPREEEDPTTWEPLLADLSPWEGEELSLRFRHYHTTPDSGARDEPSIGLGGTLENVRAYWGTPLVVGDLPRDRRPNIVICTLDTLRADRLTPELTPFLTRLAGDGVLYEDAWSACNSTSPSHSSILTGLHVSDHGVIDNYSVLAAETVTLAELLRDAGYHTAGAVSVRHLQAGSSGLGQGMDQFLLAAPRASTNGGLTLAAVRQWMREWQGIGDRPFFLWVHFFDPHTPYGPPPDFLEAYVQRRGLTIPPKDTVSNPPVPDSHYTKPGAFLHEVRNLEYATFLYDAGVAYTDHLMSELWSEFEQQGLAEDTALFVTADHGESLGEHGHFFHHTDLFQDVMQVPLIAVVPGGPRGVRTQAEVSTLDIASTVRDLLGLDRDVVLRGENLLELATTGRRPERIRFAHSHLQQLGTCSDELYFISTVEDYEQLGRDERIPRGTLQLFDRLTDPELERNLAEERLEQARELEAELDAWRKGALNREGARRELTDAELEELERLGYTDVRGEDE